MILLFYLHNMELEVSCNSQEPLPLPPFNSVPVQNQVYILASQQYISVQKGPILSLQLLWTMYTWFRTWVSTLGMSQSAGVPCNSSRFSDSFLSVGGEQYFGMFLGWLNLHFFRGIFPPPVEKNVI